jgi:hypothetical protein
MIPTTNTQIGKLIRERLLAPPAADELATLVDLSKAEILVFEQQSVELQITSALAKASGCAVVIDYTGFTLGDKNAGRPRLVETYKISVISKPVIDRGNLPAELVRKSIILRMWHWRPRGGHAFGEVTPTQGGITPSEDFLIYDCDVTIPVTL